MAESENQDWEDGHFQGGGGRNAGETSPQGHHHERAANAEQGERDGGLAQGLQRLVEERGQGDAEKRHDQAQQPGQHQGIGGDRARQAAQVHFAQRMLAGLKDDDRENVIGGHDQHHDDDRGGHGLPGRRSRQYLEAIGQNGKADVGEVAAKGRLHECSARAIGHAQGVTHHPGEEGNQDRSGHHNCVERPDRQAGVGLTAGGGEDQRGQGDPESQLVEIGNEGRTQKPNMRQRRSQGNQHNQRREDGEDQRHDGTWWTGWTSEVSIIAGMLSPSGRWWQVGSAGNARRIPLLTRPRGDEKCRFLTTALFAPIF